MPVTASRLPSANKRENITTEFEIKSTPEKKNEKNVLQKSGFNIMAADITLLPHDKLNC